MSVLTDAGTTIVLPKLVGAQVRKGDELPGDFDVKQITWRPDYDQSYCDELSKPARKIYLFRDEYIFDRLSRDFLKSSSCANRRKRSWEWAVWRLTEGGVARLELAAKQPCQPVDARWYSEVCDAGLSSREGT